MTFLRDVFRPILFFITFVLLFILLVLADKLSGLGISNNINAIESLYLFSLVLTGIFIFPTIRKDFQNRFILNKNKLYVTIGLPILIGILMQVILTLIRFIPIFLGHDMIGIESGQITYTSDVTKTGFLFLVSVIGPFNEEIVFRYSLYAGIFVVLADFKTKFSWIEKVYDELFTHKNPIYMELGSSNQHRICIITWTRHINLLFIFHSRHNLRFVFSKIGIPISLVSSWGF